MIRIPHSRFATSAVVVLAASFVLAVVTAVQAARIAPVEATTAPPVATKSGAYMPAPAPSIDVEAIGSNDIFQPDRTALQYRYRMPGESAPDNTPAPEVPKPSVLGTVIATDGAHFATVQLPGGRATLVRVGDRLGEYTVTAIERERVVFKTAKGAPLEVTTKRPVP